jgi:hypothetical protein
MRFKSLVLVAVLFLAGFSVKISADNENSLEALSHKVVSADRTESAAAIAALREQGPEGLAAFIGAHAEELKLLNADISAPLPEWNERSKMLSAALDSISAQRDARASLLYWYTDLEEAKAAARLEQKPILSLRLLGRLDEELSCANSRLFRLTLYSNKEVAAYLREHYILHWKSERPVPKVTIDFGDGRKLERTITGNSIHYVLDSTGRPLDALPGLYGPQAFLRLLAQSENLVKNYSTRSPKEQETFLRQHHAKRLKEVGSAMAADFAKQGWPMPVLPKPVVEKPQNPPTAETAGRRARSKNFVIESPLLSKISTNPRALRPTSEDEAWAAISSLYYRDAQLDTNSRALIRSKNPDIYGPLNNSAAEALKRTITVLERSIADDTMRNEYLFHAAIHNWFARELVGNDLEKLNERVYSELFLTPRSDPWLGLMPIDSYTGIDGDGIKK